MRWALAVVLSVVRGDGAEMQLHVRLAGRRQQATQATGLHKVSSGFGADGCQQLTKTAIHNRSFDHQGTHHVSIVRPSHFESTLRSTFRGHAIGTDRHPDKDGRGVGEAIGRPMDWGTGGRCILEKGPRRRSCPYVRCGLVRTGSRRPRSLSSLDSRSPSKNSP